MKSFCKNNTFFCLIFKYLFIKLYILISIYLLLSIEKLKNLMVDQELDLRRLKNGIQPRRVHTRANRNRNTKIFNAQKSLIEKRYFICLNK